MGAVGVGGHPACDGLQVQKAQSQDGKQEYHLPVAKAGAGMAAANPTVNAEIVEGRKFPDLFGMRGELAELAADQADQHVQRKHHPGAAAERGYGQQSPAGGSGKASGNGAEQNRGFKGEITGKETLLRAKTDPDPARQLNSTPRGNRHPRDQVEAVFERALLAEQQRLEFNPG